MKLFPLKGWVKTTCLVLLVFVITSVLWIILLIHTPVKQIHFVNFWVRFGFLELTKQLVYKTKIDDFPIYLYKESLNNPVTIAESEELKQIVKESIRQFPDFISKHHKIELPSIKFEPLTIIVMSQKTYYWLDLIYIYYRHTTTSSYTQPDRIYIGTQGYFDILKNESMIRHEIFHWLSFQYGLMRFIPHSDSEKFADLKINRE